MTFLDLFAGIGGFRLGMEQAGHHCIGFVKLMNLLGEVIRQSMIQVRRWKCMTSQVYQTSLFDPRTSGHPLRRISVRAMRS